MVSRDQTTLATNVVILLELNQRNNFFKCNTMNYSIGLIRSHLYNLALLNIILWIKAKLSPLDKYYEVMLRRQKTCRARSNMQMTSELCHPIRHLLILGSTVRVPRGFSISILYKSPY